MNASEGPISGIASLWRRNSFVAGVLLGNIIPALGVLFFGWDAFLVVFVYWVENAVIGVFTVLRIALARPSERTATAGDKLASISTGFKGCLIPFFIVHYGMFMLVHLAFIVILLGTNLPFAFGRGPVSIDNPVAEAAGFFHRFDTWTIVTLIAAVGSLVFEHGWEFYRGYVQSGQFRTADVSAEMFRPYARIVVLHLAILFGGFALVFLGLPRIMVVLLVILKTGLELRQRPRENRGDGNERSGSVRV